MFDDLSELSDSPASYLAVLALVALDAVFPVAPSETVLVTGGILIERGDLIAPVFVLAAACGAVLGDSILFGLGSHAGPGLRVKLFSSERARERLRVVERLVHERTWLLIVSDFVPGGRTAAMFAAGALGLPAPRFYGFIVPGALLWAMFYTLLGIAGGSLFEQGWGAFAVSIGVVAGLLSVILLRACFGVFAGHVAPLCAVAALTIFASAAATAGIQAVAGTAGTGIVIILFVILGNAASGGPFARPLLPGLWRTIGGVLPPGASMDLARAVLFFDGARIAGPILVLAGWAAAGAALVIALGGRVVSMAEAEAEAAAGAAV